MTNVLTGSSSHFWSKFHFLKSFATPAFMSVHTNTTYTHAYIGYCCSFIKMQHFQEETMKFYRGDSTHLLAVVCFPVVLIALFFWYFFLLSFGMLLMLLIFFLSCYLNGRMIDLVCSVGWKNGTKRKYLLCFGLSSRWVGELLAIWYGAFSLFLNFFSFGYILLNDLKVLMCVCLFLLKMELNILMFSNILSTKFDIMVCCCCWCYCYCCCYPMRDTTMQWYFTECSISSSTVVIWIASLCVCVCRNRITEILLIVIFFTSHEFIKRFNVTFKALFMDHHLFSKWYEDRLPNLGTTFFRIFNSVFFSLFFLSLVFLFLCVREKINEFENFHKIVRLTVHAYISWSSILQTYSIFQLRRLLLLLPHFFITINFFHIKIIHNICIFFYYDGITSDALK